MLLSSSMAARYPRDVGKPISAISPACRSPPPLPPVAKPAVRRSTIVRSLSCCRPSPLALLLVIDPIHHAAVVGQPPLLPVSSLQPIFPLFPLPRIHRCRRRCCPSSPLLSMAGLLSSITVASSLLLIAAHRPMVAALKPPPPPLLPHLCPSHWHTHLLPHHLLHRSRHTHPHQPVLPHPPSPHPLHGCRPNHHHSLLVLAAAPPATLPPSPPLSAMAATSKQQATSPRSQAFAMAAAPSLLEPTFPLPIVGHHPCLHQPMVQHNSLSSLPSSNHHLHLPCICH